MYQTHIVLSRFLRRRSGCKIRQEPSRRTYNAMFKIERNKKPTSSTSGDSFMRDLSRILEQILASARTHITPSLGKTGIPQKLFFDGRVSRQTHIVRALISTVFGVLWHRCRSKSKGSLRQLLKNLVWTRTQTKQHFGEMESRCRSKSWRDFGTSAGKDFRCGPLTMKPSWPPWKCGRHVCFFL